MPEPPIDQEKQRKYDAYAREAASHSVIKLSSKNDHDEQQKIMKETAPYMTLGVQMGLTIAAFFGAGWWLDKHFGTKPLWTAILSGIGAIAGLTYFIVTVLRLSKKTETK